MTLMNDTDLTRNKQLVDRFIQELFSRGDLTAIDRYVDPDFVDHDPPVPGIPGDAEGFRRAAALFRQAFPDWRSELHQLTAEDDLVTERFTASGTHSGGELLGVAPSGATVVLKGINMFRIRDDKIIERWGRLDDAGLLRQLGLIDG